MEEEDMIRDMNFFEMSNAELDKAGFRWGKIDLVKLLRAVNFDLEHIDFESMEFNDKEIIPDEVLISESAQAIFDTWMNRKLSGTQKFLVRINFGQEKISYPNSEFYEHNVLGRRESENVEDLQKALELVARALKTNGYLYHALFGIGFGVIGVGTEFDEETDPRWKWHEVDKENEDGYFVNLWKNLTRWFGIHEVEGDKLKSNEIYERIVDHFESNLVKNSIWYALVGRGELVLDDNYLVYGVDVEDMHEELQNACWEYVKEHLKPWHIANALKGYLEDELLPDPEIKAKDLSALAFAIYVFGRDGQS